MEDTILLESFKTNPKCVQCGSYDLQMPTGITSQDDLANDSTITCGVCGVITTYGAIMEAWKARVTDHLTDIGIIGGTE
jgi:hypothetical protein